MRASPPLPRELKNRVLARLVDLADVEARGTRELGAERDDVLAQKLVRLAERGDGLLAERLLDDVLERRRLDLGLLVVVVDADPDGVCEQSSFKPGESDSPFGSFILRASEDGMGSGDARTRSFATSSAFLTSFAPRSGPDLFWMPWTRTVGEQVIQGSMRPQSGSAPDAALSNPIGWSPHSPSEQIARFSPEGHGSCNPSRGGSLR